MEPCRPYPQLLLQWTPRSLRSSQAVEKRKDVPVDPEPTFRSRRECGKDSFRGDADGGTEGRSSVLSAEEQLDLADRRNRSRLRGQKSSLPQSLPEAEELGISSLAVETVISVEIRSWTAGDEENRPIVRSRRSSVSVHRNRRTTTVATRYSAVRWEKTPLGQLGGDGERS